MQTTVYQCEATLRGESKREITHLRTRGQALLTTWWKERKEERRRWGSQRNERRRRRRRHALLVYICASFLFFSYVGQVVSSFEWAQRRRRRRECKIFTHARRINGPNRRDRIKRQNSYTRGWDLHDIVVKNSFHYEGPSFSRMLFLALHKPNALGIK